MAVEQEQPAERTRAQIVADRGRALMHKLVGDEASEMPDVPPASQEATVPEDQSSDEKTNEAHID